MILWEQLGVLDELVFRPLRERTAAVPLWVWLGLLAGAVALGAFGLAADLVEAFLQLTDAVEGLLLLLPAGGEAAQADDRESC